MQNHSGGNGVVLGMVSLLPYLLEFWFCRYISGDNLALNKPNTMCLQNELEDRDLGGKNCEGIMLIKNA